MWIPILLSKLENVVLVFVYLSLTRGESHEPTIHNYDTTKINKISEQDSTFLRNTVLISPTPSMLLRTTNNLNVWQTKILSSNSPKEIPVYPKYYLSSSYSLRASPDPSSIFRGFSALIGDIARTSAHNNASASPDLGKSSRSKPFEQLFETRLYSSLNDIFDTSYTSSIEHDSSCSQDFKSLSSIKISEVATTFRTPLLSLFSTSTSVPNDDSAWPHSGRSISLASHSLTSLDINNEVQTPNVEFDQKKLLMLVLKAEDCARFSKEDFEKMLTKLMTKFGFGDIVPEVSTARCYSHLNINLTVGGTSPTLRFLPTLDGKNNFSVDILNRTFRIVKLEKVDLKLEKTRSNATTSIITAVAKHESIAYIAVGVSFGLVLVICISVCCLKCCCFSKSRKRLGMPTSPQTRLRPEDYTLTPLPRPTSLYVDYYRTADIYSTTSAGSIASTTPTVEQGVVHPFDTSIVPLEDSSALAMDTGHSRDPSVESVPDLKTFNIKALTITGQALRDAPTESKEMLNPNEHPSRTNSKKARGVSNPSFQRY